MEGHKFFYDAIRTFIAIKEVKAFIQEMMK